jgi:predicted AlkP superfamily phosphohydrolase/phosphomutase
MQEGFLTLTSPPGGVTPLEDVQVDWGRTRAWSSGGYYARIFLNVKGRETEGAIDPEDYEDIRDELVARLEATVDDEGNHMGTRVFKPEAIYARVEGIPPDLIVHFGDLAWRAVGGVGYGRIHVQENDTGPDDCNHAQFGAFVLSGPGVPESGWVERARLIDLAPSLLAGAGYDRPPSMQGRDLWDAGELRSRDEVEVLGVSLQSAADGEAIIRERLRGLGYLS